MCFKLLGLASCVAENRRSCGGPLGPRQKSMPYFTTLIRFVLSSPCLVSLHAPNNVRILCCKGELFDFVEPETDRCRQALDQLGIQIFLFVERVKLKHSV
jgi:hypothetical protein